MAGPEALVAVAGATAVMLGRQAVQISCHDVVLGAFRLALRLVRCRPQHDARMVPVTGGSAAHAGMMDHAFFVGAVLRPRRWSIQLQFGVDTNAVTTRAFGRVHQFVSPGE